MLDELTRARRRETAERLSALLDLVARGLIDAEDVLVDSWDIGVGTEHAPSTQSEVRGLAPH